MSNSLIIRDSGGKFKKGTIANPGGKPSELREITALARTYSVDALATLHRIATDRNAPVFAQIAAAESLLNRGYGKPVATSVQVNQPANPAAVEAVLSALRAGGALSRARFQPLIDAQEADEHE